MPFKRKYRKKRPYRRRRYRRKRKVMPPIGGFPKSMMTRLKYVQNISLDPTAGVGAIQVFRANSVYDPDMTGTGHQPSNFDKLATIYDRYTVVGSKIRVYPNFVSTSGINPYPTVVVALTEDGTDLATVYASGGIENVLEQPRISRFTKPLGVLNASGQWSITKTFSAKKFFSTKNLIGAGLYSSDIGTNPSEGAFFEIGAFSPDGSADPTSMPFRS